MKYWTIKENEFELNREITVEGHTMNYSYQKQKYRTYNMMKNLLSNDTYITNEEKQELLNYFK